MSDTNREAAIILVMRQCAIFNGVNLDKVTPQVRARYRTLALNCIASVERKQTAYNWNSEMRDRRYMTAFGKIDE